MLHPDQVEDLALDQVVEIGGRLVGDDEGRAQRDHHGDQGTLQHAAAELMRMGGEHACGHADAHVLQDAAGLIEPVAVPVAGRALPACDRLLEMPGNGLGRIERADRVLEDHGELDALQVAEFVVRQPGQFLSAKANGVGRNRRVRWQQA